MADNFSIKDAAVLIPIVGSSLAITWEVGRFSQLGGFRYFSFAEHLTAATNYLPMAITVSAAVFVSFWFGRRDARLSKGMHFVAWFGGTMISIGFGFLLRAYLDAGRDYWALVAICSVASLAAIFIDNPFNSTGGIAALFAFGILSTLVLANAFTNETVAEGGSNPNKYATEITFKDGSKKTAIALMSGDRGVLFYDPSSRRTNLVRWDDIKGLDWGVQ